MGFTPAAWTAWDTYNILGKAILTLFLFICHFLIVTILITVLTNSFMAIVSNANEEHQFVFAVNTISMVKNDALFSYVAPTNLLAWVLTPTRYLMPFRQFVKLNRYVIKVTHFPLLFGIFAYEKFFLASTVYEPTDLIENRSHDRIRLASYVDPATVKGLFSPSVRIRQEPADGIQKDRALEEVFRMPPRETFQSTMKSQERRHAANVVDNWIEQHDGIASPPSEQDHSIVERLERSGRSSRRVTTRRLEREISGVRSIASDPADLMSTGTGRHYGFQPRRPGIDHLSTAQTAEDGDDELLTNEDEDNGTLEPGNIDSSIDEREDYFHTPKAGAKTPVVSTLADSQKHLPAHKSPAARVKAAYHPAHARNLSSNTILYNPTSAPDHFAKQLSSSTSPPKSRSDKKSATGPNTPQRRAIYGTSKPRPIFPTRQALQFQSTPTVRQLRRRRSTLDLESNVGLDANVNMGGVPSSFATQMAMATGLVRNNRGNGDDDNERMMGRLMLARMKTLEEGFAEIVREIRESRESRGGSTATTVIDTTERRRDKKGKGVARSRPGTSSGIGGPQTGKSEDDNHGESSQGTGDFVEKGSSL